MVNTAEPSTEHKILAAARDVFLQKGLSGARMQDIADRAGINKAMLHYYFRSKEKLFEVIFLQAAGTLFPKINAILNAEIPLFDKIREFTREYLKVIIANPYLPQFVFSEMNRQPEGFSQMEFFLKHISLEKFFTQVRAEIKSGLIRDIRPENLIINILAICVFPFIGKPIIKMVMKMDEGSFHQLMEERIDFNAEFIIASIKNFSYGENSELEN
jgi:TetR/AcrR family transcriptional regulator